MSEFSWNSVFTIIGVIVGFSLSQFAEFLKGRGRKGMVKKALRNEISIAKESLSNAKNNGCRLVKEDFPLITDTYDSLKVELASLLVPSKLALVQRAYQQINQLNQPKSERTTIGYIMMLDSSLVYQHDLSEDIRVLEKSIDALT